MKKNEEVLYEIGGEAPLLVSVRRMGDTLVEFLRFVEPGDPDSLPFVWTMERQVDILRSVCMKRVLFVSAAQQRADKIDREPAERWLAFIKTVRCRKNKAGERRFSAAWTETNE